MKRRSLLAAGATGLALPAVLRGAGTQGAAQTLRFIPQSDLTVLDPHWTTAYVTRNHGFMVFDTLYGTNGAYEPSPQMLAGDIPSDQGNTALAADAAGRPDVPRRHAGAGAGLRSQHQALGARRTASARR